MGGQLSMYICIHVPIFTCIYIYMMILHWNIMKFGLGNYHYWTLIEVILLMDYKATEYNCILYWLIWVNSWIYNIWTICLNKLNKEFSFCFYYLFSLSYIYISRLLVHFPLMLFNFIDKRVNNLIFGVQIKDRHVASFK